MDVVYEHFAFVCFVFHKAAPIPYLKVAILNLPHPKVRSTTVLLDKILPKIFPFASVCFGQWVGRG